jgi:serine phosphatase RsbU (regulator of sigma subunit)
MKLSVFILLFIIFGNSTFGQTNHQDSINEMKSLVKSLDTCKNKASELNVLFQLHYYQQSLLGELSEKNVADLDLKYTKQAIQLAVDLQKYDTLKSLTVDLGYIFDLRKEFDSSFTYYSNCLNIFEASNNYQLTYSIAPAILYNNSQLQGVIEENSKKAIEQKKKIDLLTYSALAALVLFLVCLLYFFYRSNYNNKILKLQKEEILKRKTETDNSISYAENIQRSILFNENKLNAIFPDSFVLFLPRDKVSGDFLWSNQIGHQVYIAVADCTGHGVPGALLSIVGHFLFDAILLNAEEKSPAKILDQLHQEIVKSLNQKGSVNSHDGMDVGLIKICLDQNQLIFAGAHRFLHYVRGNEIHTINGTKKPIGGTQINYKNDFEDTIVDLQKGDVLYCYTDGFADQMGGHKRKKFMKKNLISLLESNSEIALSSQKEVLKNTFNTHKGQLEQTDDVLIIGIKI